MCPILRRGGEWVHSDHCAWCWRYTHGTLDVPHEIEEVRRLLREEAVP